MSVDLVRDEPRRRRPHIDPDLPSGRIYGYRNLARRINTGPAAAQAPRRTPRRPP